MTTEFETLENATIVIMNKQAKLMNGMIDDYERRQYISDDYAEHSLGQILQYEETLDPKGKYDHEEVYVATGEYTVGRID